VLDSGYCPTGSLVFTLTGPGGFSFTQTDTVNGNGTYTAGTTLPTTGTVAGTYTWSVSYAGDANNQSAVDQGGAPEQTLVSPAQPTIVTTASPAVTLSTGTVTLSDSAVLAAGYFPTGNLVFTLTGPGGFTYTQTDTVNGNGTYTASTTLPTSGAVAGVYTWSASYAGNANNSSAIDQGGAAEQVRVNFASPSINTTTSPSVVVEDGVFMNDSATLTGASAPTGTITFTLTAPGGGVVYTDVVPVIGNGTYSTSGGSNPGGFMPTIAGTYQWVARYSGDARNQPVASPFGDEPHVAIPSSPQLQLVTLTDVSNNNFGTGPLLIVGSIVTWEYPVRNNGNMRLTDVHVTDDHPNVIPVYKSGDVNNNGLLDPGEVWLFTASDIVKVGQYFNVGTVTARTIDPITLTATDPDRYFGILEDIPEVDPSAFGKLDLLALPLLAGPHGDPVAQAAFVSALYQDVLGRQADIAAVNVCVGLLQVGVTRAQLVQAVWESPEHRRDQVDQFYQALLHRPAEAGGMAYWGGLLLGGQSEEQVEAGILASPEYTSTHPDAVSFVSGLYNDVLTRPPGVDAAYWVGRLLNGASREQVAREVVASPEAVVLGLARDYAAFLRRELDTAGEQYWVALGLATRTPAEIDALGVLASDEYFQTAGALAGL
jgi:hypothetical protein